MNPTLDQWKQTDRKYSMLPLAVQFPLRGLNIDGWLAEREREKKPFFLLESGKIGRYTFLGGTPFLAMQSKNGRTELIYRSESNNTFDERNPLVILRELLQRYVSPTFEGLPKFCGGAVGYFSYDLVRAMERLPEIATDDLKLPDLSLMWVDELIVIDHETETAYAIVHYEAQENRQEEMLSTAYVSLGKRLEKMKEDLLVWELTPYSNHPANVSQLTQPPTNPNVDFSKLEGIQPSFTEADFVQAVRRIQQYITAGDVFQVNLSVRQSRLLNAPPLEVYRQLRKVNPSPYMGVIHFPEYQFISASPELLVRVEKNIVETRPIAGTRPRGDNREEDLRLAQELIDNEKERAEHIMLVDLERNDLGKVCRFGSVEVNELMVIEEYSHVMHIVSNVRGILDNGKDPVDVIQAVFPGGTITGAPKIRTMEIIEELEPVRRGPYTGSFGWIDYNGNMELNIIIRTMVTSAGWAHVQAGAGIVIDSDPEREYTESLNKAKAVWKAIQLSEEACSLLVQQEEN